MRNKKNKKRLPLLIIMLLILVYGLGVLFFSDRFFMNTYIDGQKIGGKKVDEVKRIIEDLSNSYELKIKTIDGRDQVIRASDVDLKYELGNNIRDLKNKQGNFGYLGGLFGKSELKSDTRIIFDKDLLKKTVKDLEIFKKEGKVKPENARIDIVNDQFTVIKEIEGNVIKKKAFYKSALSHVENQETTMDIEEEGLYKKPDITSTDKRIVIPMKTLENYNNSRINYDIEGADEKIGPEEIKNWVEIDSDTNEVSLNRDKVAEFVQTLARKYDTFSRTRTFKSTNSGEITISGGTYGWLIERGKETDRIIEDISSGKQVRREPIYRYKAKSRIGGDIGDTYVEIDISKQHMWFYKDKKLIVDTPVVTGKTTKSRYTPTGVYPLNYKTKDATLRGQDYSSEVKVWMPFNNNIGIHDASWRASFGGNIYQSRGSHGCINTPYAAAKKIFDVIEKGDPIVVYASGSYVIRPDAPPPKKEEPEKEDEKNTDNKKTDNKKNTSNSEDDLDEE